MVGRTVPEWIGKTPDSAIPPHVRLRVFERWHGVCQCGCGWKIVSGQPWQADHIKSLIMGGENRESNLQPLLTQHHKGKTALDVAKKSKVYQQRSYHLGVKQSKNPLPGSRRSKWKKKLDGTVVLRNQQP